MPGSIQPLPVMLDDRDRKVYEALQAPKSMVVRYGYMKLVAELPYDGSAKPGCGSQLVIRTDRGTELAVMLTTTCSNSGCGSSVSRRQMLEYIENSGGKKYPFTTHGRILRVATADDLLQQEKLDDGKRELIREAKAIIQELELPMKLVDVELLLGGERIIYHYAAEQYVDFREMVQRLAKERHSRIEMHQVSARDEARITADYEKCGQYCCCKQFLKVLKPVSMRSAKVQKQTLDPQKISGRCGRLMCCLRYEDETYDELRKKLPHKQTRVMTEDGSGTVIDTQILTQLALVRLDQEMKVHAYPIEHIRPLTKEEDAQAKEALAAREEEARQRMERKRAAMERQGGGPRPSNPPQAGPGAPERRDAPPQAPQRRPVPPQRTPSRPGPRPGPGQSEAPTTGGMGPDAGTPSSERPALFEGERLGEGSEASDGLPLQAAPGDSRYEGSLDTPLGGEPADAEARGDGDAGESDQPRGPWDAGAGPAGEGQPGPSRRRRRRRRGPGREGEAQGPRASAGQPGGPEAGHEASPQGQTDDGPEPAGDTFNPRGTGDQARPRRPEPRRPAPGRPLEDHEVESREGSRPVDPTDFAGSEGAQGGSDAADGEQPSLFSDESGGADPGPGEGAPDQAGQAPRRRRRRRGRGRGPRPESGPDAGPQGPSTPNGPPPTGPEV